jgi:hypothetical protein
MDTLFFLLRWDRYRFQKKCVEARYTKLVFLHLVGYAGHIVHCGASRTRNNDALFFLLGWDRDGFHKMCRDTLRRTCVFASSSICGHVVISCASGV